MKYPIILTENKIFGNLGIAWLFPLVIVWKHGPHVEQTIEHEYVHMKQWLEVWAITAPLIAFTIANTGLSWLLMAAVYPSYWAVYAILHNAMERDARKWAEAIDDRPAYFWVNA